MHAPTHAYALHACIYVYECVWGACARAACMLLSILYLLACVRMRLCGWICPFPVEVSVHVLVVMYLCPLLGSFLPHPVITLRVEDLFLLPVSNSPALTHSYKA